MDGLRKTPQDLVPVHARERAATVKMTLWTSHLSSQPGLGPRSLARVARASVSIGGGVEVERT
jgi:hypothetical protein